MGRCKMQSSCDPRRKWRRNFSEADKRRIVEETCREGASVSGVARTYGIATRLLFSWKKELTPETSAGPAFR